MPIRLVDAHATAQFVVGEISQTLSGGVANFDGTVSLATGVSGTLSASTAGTVSNFDGLFDLAPNRAGSLAVTLANDPSNISGSFTVPGLPTAPSNLLIVVASDSVANLSWVDNSINELSFEVERSTDQQTWAAIAGSPFAANTTNATDSAVNQSGALYYYRVRSTNAAGNSVWATSAAQSQWISEPSIQFVDGTSSTYDLNSDVAGFAQSFTLESGALPSTITLSAGGILTFTDTGSDDTFSGSFTFAYDDGRTAGNLLVTLPSLTDEQNAYNAQGLTWAQSDHELWTSGAQDPARFQAGWGATIDVHGGTEGDDLWMAINQFERYNGIDQSEADNWLIRAGNMRNYFVDDYLVEGIRNNDASQNADHLYGWGLADWIRIQGSDSGALSALNALRAEMDGPDYDDVFGGETPGDDIGSQGNTGRRWARWLRFACALVERDSQTANVTFRDKVADLILQSPNWDTGWPGQTTEQAFIVTKANYTGYDGLDFAGGDRIANLFHNGLMADSLWNAWRVYSAEGDTTRANDFRSKVIGLADFWLSVGTGSGDGGLYRLYSGFNTNTGQVLRSGGFGTGRGVNVGGGVSGIYTVSVVNNMVFAYKFTGTQAYLDEAWRCWRLWQQLTAGTANEVDHFADTIHQPGTVVMGNNKGELQYVYALFENGGSPTLV